MFDASDITPMVSSKILYMTDLAQKLLSLHIFNYLCAYLAISAHI